MNYRMVLYNYHINERFTSFKKAKEFLDSMKGKDEDGEIYSYNNNFMIKVWKIENGKITKCIKLKDWESDLKC